MIHNCQSRKLEKQIQLCVFVAWSSPTPKFYRREQGADLNRGLQHSRTSGLGAEGCDQLSQSRRLSIKKLSLKAVKAMDTTLPLRRCRAQLKTKLSSPWCVDPVARWWALKQQALRRILYHFDDQENRMIWTSVFNEAWGTKEHSSEVNTGLTMYPPPPALRNLGLVFDPFFSSVTWIQNLAISSII